jgi:2'-5' RNA ligase
MRLFTGLSLPPHIIANLEEVVRELRPLAPIRWSPDENLHITTKFIGEWPFDRLPELSRKLWELRPEGAVPVRIVGLSFFPLVKRPKVFFAKADGNPELTALAARTDALLAGHLKIPAELREYSPHVTLARVPGPMPLQPLFEMVRTLESNEFGSFEAEEFHLYESKPMTYRIIESFPLK